MKHTLEGQLVIMQRLRLQAYTGVTRTATIKDGLAPFTHHGHGGFPYCRTTDGLDSHLGPAPPVGKRPYRLDLVWDGSIVDDRVHAKLLGQPQALGSTATENDPRPTPRRHGRQHQTARTVPIHYERIARMEFCLVETVQHAGQRFG